MTSTALVFQDLKKAFTFPVLVVALGYFVDIFDLTLFSMLRNQSLTSLGVSPENLVDVGISLLNSQMLGMLIGGLLWGVLGDKKGRLKVLFGSIILYSTANILNGFVQTIPQYQILRFISGLGLAGELGAGITLISETLPKNIRGLGTTIVASIGVAGAVFGGFFVEFFDWRICFIIGGGLGLALLFLRFKVHESQLFRPQEKELDHTWGNLVFAFKSFERVKKFILCILLGAPIWYVAGLLMTFAPELAKILEVDAVITSSRAIAISYLGLAFGDFFSGAFSQVMQSRKRSVLFFIFITVIFITLLFTTTAHKDQFYYYTICFCIGLGAGFWAIFVTIAAEQFGTNLRATMATSIPNFVRGSVVPMTLLFKYLKEIYGFKTSMIAVGILVFTLSIVATLFLDETFHKELDYLEKH